MKPDEVIEKFKQYSEIAQENYRGSHEQIAIDALSLTILDGDVEKFKQYHEAAENNYSGSHTQIAIDTLNMVLMDRTESISGLLDLLLTKLSKI